VTATRSGKIGLAVALVAVLVCGLVVVLRPGSISRTKVTAYFENSNGIYPGDDVRILGVRVGTIESIEPQPRQAKITFWVDNTYKIPADAKAVILSPTLVTSRFIQLTPAYTGGPQLQNNAVISRDRTAVPVEWDDLRTQLAKLNKTLQPTQPGGVSSTGELVNTLASNLRGQGASIRDTVMKLSQALSTLGDHSGDIFGTVKNLAVLVSALHDSTDLMRQLNGNLAAVTGLLVNDPNEVGTAVADLNTAVGDVRSFVADNREALGTTSDKLAEVLKALGESLDDIKQALHVFPTTLSNFINIYKPAHAAASGALSASNFANPIQFICGSIQAASRLNAEQSAKLCVQYLAPIVKNRQYNFLGPLGFNGAPLTLPIPVGPVPLPFPVLPVGAMARPNEITFSEDWMRPDYVPPAAPGSAETASGGPSAGAPVPDAPLAAEAPPPSDTAAPGPAVPTNPSAGLEGIMVPPGAGS
jgi:phospholipid/cholesterol/gamma-HCH transport system substrate-binding protein